MIKQASRKLCLVLKEYFIVFQDIPMELVWLLNENSIVPFRACFLRLASHHMISIKSLTLHEECFQFEFSEQRKFSLVVIVDR
jgi:hypothetical protein